MLFAMRYLDLLASINERFISALCSKVCIIQALNGERSARRALRVQCLADTNLKCVFVADEGFIKSRNLEGFSSLIWCVNAGGIIAIRQFPFGPLPLSLQVLGTSSISSEKKKGGGTALEDERLSIITGRLL